MSEQTKFYSELADERIAFQEFRLVWEAVEPHKAERAGKGVPELPEYSYGSKHFPVDSAETVMKAADNPSWETIVWEQARLRGGEASFDGIEGAAENFSQ